MHDDPNAPRTKKRRTTFGLEPGTHISVATGGGRRRHGTVTRPNYVSAHGHVRVEYCDKRNGGIYYAKLEDVRVERSLERRRRREKKAA